MKKFFIILCLLGSSVRAQTTVADSENYDVKVFSGSPCVISYHDNLAGDKIANECNIVILKKADQLRVIFATNAKLPVYQINALFTGHDNGYVSGSHSALVVDYVQMIGSFGSSDEKTIENSVCEFGYSGTSLTEVSCHAKTASGFVKADIQNITTAHP